MTQLNATEESTLVSSFNMESVGGGGSMKVDQDRGLESVAEIPDAPFKTTSRRRESLRALSGIIHTMNKDESLLGRGGPNSPKFKFFDGKLIMEIQRKNIYPAVNV